MYWGCRYHELGVGGIPALVFGLVCRWLSPVSELAYFSPAHRCVHRVCAFVRGCGGLASTNGLLVGIRHQELRSLALARRWRATLSVVSRPFEYELIRPVVRNRFEMGLFLLFPSTIRFRLTLTAWLNNDTRQWALSGAMARAWRRTRPFTNGSGGRKL
jgi:hypothetical protein